MSCTTTCGCACHAPIELQLAEVGIPLGRLSRTESAVAAALLPAGDWFTAETIWRRARPDEPYGSITGQSHVLNVHLARLRRRLAPLGWAIERGHSIGYRLIQVEPYTPAPMQPSSHRPSDTRTFLENAEQRRQVLDAIRQGLSMEKAAPLSGVRANLAEYARDIDPVWRADVDRARVSRPRPSKSRAFLHDSTRQVQFLDAVAEGIPLKDAAGSVGLSRGALKWARAIDPSLTNAIEMARAQRAS